MDAQNNIVGIPYKGEIISVPRSKIKGFERYLRTKPAFSEANATAHIGLIYSGNLIAVREFMAWRERNEP